MCPSDLKRLRDEADVSAILSLQHDDCHRYWGIDFSELESSAVDMGLVLRRHSIRDFDIDDMRRQLPRAIAHLSRLQRDGHRTYVHCTAGLGRAPLVCLAFLILVEGWDPEVAIGSILHGRPGAVPAWEALHGASDDLAAHHRAAIERRAYELHEAGIHGDSGRDWQAAQAEVVREALLQMAAAGDDSG